MGVEYSLLKDDVRFDLDKGNWNSLFDDINNIDEQFLLSCYYTDAQKLADDIRNKVYYNNPNMDDEYCLEVANRILNWCGESSLKLIYDNVYDEYHAIKITEDRFVPRLFNKENL